MDWNFMVGSLWHGMTILQCLMVIQLAKIFQQVMTWIEMEMESQIVGHLDGIIQI